MLSTYVEKSKLHSTLSNCPTIGKKEKNRQIYWQVLEYRTKKITLEICGNGICLGEIIPFRDVTSCDTTCGRLVFRNSLLS